MVELTTIQIQKETREKLLSLKEYTRETYDEILNKLMKVFELVKKEQLSDEAIKGIEEGRKDVREGRVLSTKELIQQLGVE
jgi:predicted transcriptional regulator